MDFVADRLNSIIKDKQEKINSINKDIAELEERRKYAAEASKLFKEASVSMSNLRNEVQNIFKGEAANAFTDKLLLFVIFCDSREEHMKKIIANIEKQLESLKKQKKKSQKIIDSVESVKKIFKIS